MKELHHKITFEPLRRFKDPKKAFLSVIYLYETVKYETNIMHVVCKPMYNRTHAVFIKHFEIYGY
jgi:hypothetical protein